MSEPDIVGLVQADLNRRRTVGLERYGHLLDVRDGRDWLTEAYEEAQDMVVYLRAAIERRQLDEAADEGPDPLNELDPWNAIEELAREVADLRKSVMSPERLLAGHGQPYTPGGLIKIGEGQYVPAPGRPPGATLTV